MENEWIINKDKFKNIELYHKHECFYFKSTRFYCGKTFQEDKQGPLCSFCLEKAPNHILFQLHLLNGTTTKLVLRHNHIVVANTISKTGNVYNKGRVMSNRTYSYSHKYVYPKLGKKKQEILNRLFDEFIIKHR